MDQKTINILLIISLIAVVVIFGIMVFQRSRGVTADWQTYKNISYGYAIKYPSSWGLIAPVDEADLLIANYPEGSPTPGPNTVVVEITAGNVKPADADLATFIKAKIAQGGDFQPSGNLVPVKLNGLAALKIDHSGGDGPDGPGYYIEKGPTDYLFILVYGMSETTTVDKIVGSIKLTR